MSTGGCKIICTPMSLWGESDDSSPLFVNNDCAKHNLAWGFTSTGLALIWPNSSDVCVILIQIVSWCFLVWTIGTIATSSLAFPDFKIQKLRGGESTTTVEVDQEAGGGLSGKPLQSLHALACFFIFPLVTSLYPLYPLRTLQYSHYFERSWASRILQNLVDAIKDGILTLLYAFVLFCLLSCLGCLLWSDVPKYPCSSSTGMAVLSPTGIL